MSSKIQAIRNKLEQRKGQLISLRKTIKSLRLEIKDLKRDYIRHEKAHEIIKQVGLATQQQLQFHISDITSLALDAVFPEPYKLKLEFVEKRNKTECEIKFVQGEEELEPLSETGGGAVDIAAFALRIASWTMSIDRTRNVIILDEPLKFLSKEYHERASQMIKEISDKLGLQFIIVTHNDTLASYADKVFEIGIHKSKGRKISKVTTNDVH